MRARKADSVFEISQAKAPHPTVQERIIAMIGRPPESPKDEKSPIRRNTESIFLEENLTVNTEQITTVIIPITLPSLPDDERGMDKQPANETSIARMILILSALLSLRSLSKFSVFSVIKQYRAFL